MTPNYSLSLSNNIQNLMRGNLLQIIQPVFPVEVIKNFQQRNPSNTRDRIYNAENTLLSMIITSIHEDKSLQNSVNIFQDIHNENITQVIDYAEKLAEEEKQNDLKNNEYKSSGRPKLYKAHISKSKIQSFSSNTAAYSKARKRLGEDLINEVYEQTKDFRYLTKSYIWKGREVFITDGAYFQMQDTKELAEKYKVQKKSPGELIAILRGCCRV